MSSPKKVADLPDATEKIVRKSIIQSDRKSTRNIEKSNEIDPRNFSLGKGSWKIKRERVGRLVESLVENEK